jgi:catechol 2,3-dioxygenase-like lactoylglutathione lyase family enzyme
MFDHVGLRVKDIAASVRFYTSILTPLDFAVGSQGDGYAGFGPVDQPGLWLHEAASGGGVHVALTAPSRAAVHAFHEAGLAAGGRDNGAPGPRPDYGPTYYAAFLIDLDGNNIEAVCMAAA